MIKAFCSYSHDQSASFLLFSRYFQVLVNFGAGDDYSEPESTSRKLLKTGLVLSGTTLIDFSPLSWVISSSFHQPIQTTDLNHLASSENMAEIIVYLACKHMKIYLSKSPHINGATLISRLF